MLDKQHRPICLTALEAGKSDVRVFGLGHIAKKTNSTFKVEKGWGLNMSAYRDYTGSESWGGA